jgi:hypothetical protein
MEETNLVEDPNEDHFKHNVGKHHIVSYGILHQQTQ